LDNGWTVPPGFFLAVCTTTVTRTDVAVVALFLIELETIAAESRASTVFALGLNGAVWRTTIVRNQVVVITLLGAFLVVVSAFCLTTSLAVWAYPARLHTTSRRATVVGVSVTIIALLVAGDDTVAALSGATRAADNRADPTSLQLARTRATVVSLDVTVIARLSPGDLLVATRRGVGAYGPIGLRIGKNGRAGPPEFD
jgi:hypothetical protein